MAAFIVKFLRSIILKTRKIILVVVAKKNPQAAAARGFTFSPNMNVYGRSSDSRITLLTAPSHPVKTGQWQIAVFVPDHSGGSVPDFHRFPYYAREGAIKVHENF